MKKKRHQLNKCQTANQFKEELLKNGIDLSQIVSQYIDETSKPGILLVGSLAEGNANSASDLDVNILLENESQFKFNIQDINLSFENRKEILLYINGIEINLIFYFKTKIYHIIKAFINIAPALYNPKDLKSFPIINEEDLQFLHQLKIGIPIENSDKVEIWRDECMVSLLPTYITVFNYFMAMEMIEDAFHNIGSEEGSTSYMGKMTVEFLLCSILGNNDFTNQNKKWLLRSLKKVKGPEANEIIAKCLILLFHPFLVSSTEEEEFVDRIKNLISDVRVLLTKDIVLDKAISYLSSEIDYITEEG